MIRFQPVEPRVLLQMAEKQFQSLERAKESLEAVLPELTSSYIISVEKPIIRTYEGVDGLKQIYEDTLKEKKEIYAVLQTAEVDQTMYKWLTQVYAKKRASAKIHENVIVASGKWSAEYQKQDEKEFRTTILVPSDRFPFQHEVDIYGDKVAFINFKKGEALIGVVIKHPQIAKTMKAWFDLAWEGACQMVSLEIP